MTTPPQPPKLTAYRAPAPPVLSWNHNPPPLPRYTYGRIIADCVDCGEETWWLRGRSADGGNSVSLSVHTGRSYRVGYLLSNDPELPIPDVPRCPACTAYRALPWWRRWLRSRADAKRRGTYRYTEGGDPN